MLVELFNNWRVIVKKETYRLSRSGIERLKAFKADVENGDICIEPIYVDQDDVEPLYFVVRSLNGTACAFSAKDNDEAVKAASRSVDMTLTAGIERNLHSCGRVFYCSKPDSGLALRREDITTPAQRALEALGARLQCNQQVIGE